MPTLCSHTHLQATQANARPKLTNKYACPTARTDKKALVVTAPWQKSGFSGYINICAFNKLLWWLDSFVLLSPLLRQAAKRCA